MILPVVSHGNSVLKKPTSSITKKDESLERIIDDMFETMYAAPGVGLAATQVGLSINLFVIDASDYSEDDPELEGFKKVFINAEILEEEGEEWLFNEGCLSFPGIREDISRKPRILMRYLDENMQEHEEWFDGIKARIIQHEYDHTRGIVFIDRMKPLKRNLLQGKLNDIKKGNVKASYKMSFAPKKKKTFIK